MQQPKPMGCEREIKPWRHGVIFLAAVAVVFARRPDALIHAQFYAESGHVWFAEAYNLGWWNALLRAQDGYFQTVSRLGGALALLAPMTLAPLVENAISIIVQAMPVNLLMSGRSAGWGPARFRAFLGTTYLLLPDYGEAGYSITESQWLLALCVFLLLVGRPPGTWAGRVFDAALIVLSGLSGPFCVFLLPIAIVVAGKRRQAWPWVAACLLAASVLVQTYALLVIDRNGRAHPPMGAGGALFVRILGGNVILGATLGRIPFATMPGRGIFILLLCAVVIGAVMVALCFIRSTIEMKLFVTFAGLILAASLLFPVTNAPVGTTVWEMLAKAPGVRYWVLPSLAFTWSLLWTARSGTALMRPVSVLFLCAMCFGIAANFRLPGLTDLHFAEYARSFDAAPAGTVMTIPENPAGWTIRLVKKAGDEGPIRRRREGSPQELRAPK
jgi:hypothetical protein